MGRAADELLSVAQARQPVLHAVALLTLGDAEPARREVVEVLAELLRGKRRGDDDGGGPEEQPQQHSRALLAVRLRERPESGPPEEPAAVTASESAGVTAPEAAGTVSTRWAWADGDEVLTATRRALAGLDGRDRLALALAELDDCPPPEALALAGMSARPGPAHELISRLLARVDDELAGLSWAPPAREALRRLADEAPAVEDALPEAVALVTTRRRRTRRLVLATLVGLAVLAGLVVAQRIGSPPEGDLPSTNPRATGTSGGAGGANPAAITVDGVRFTLAVPVADVPRLPELPGVRDQLQLPPRLALPDGDIPPLTAGLVGEAGVRAVLVRRLPDGTGRVVLYVPKAPPQYVEVTDVVIPPPLPGVEAVNARTVSNDHRRLVLFEADGIAIVDVRTAVVTRVPFGHGPGQAVGWGPGDQWIIVESLGNPARIDPATGEHQLMSPPGAAGRFVLVQDRVLTRLGFNHLGTLVEQDEVPGPVVRVVGDTVSSLSGWSAAGADFASELIPARATKGVYAVALDLSPQAAALVVRPGEDRTDVADCCRALAWGPSDRLLYAAPAPDVLRILAWDVTSGRQYRVSELPLPDFAQGSRWYGEFALAQ